MESLEMGIVRGVITVVSLATFLGICWWAYRPSSKGRFENDGWLVFESDEAEARIPARVRETDGSGEGKR